MRVTPPLFALLPNTGDEYLSQQRRGGIRKTGPVHSVDFFLADKNKMDKKGTGKGNLTRKIVRRGREHFFESLTFADRNNNFLEHAVGHEFESCKLRVPHGTAFGCGANIA